MLCPALQHALSAASNYPNSCTLPPHTITYRTDCNIPLNTYTVTQNIDSLEHEAGLPRDKVVAAHGNFDSERRRLARHAAPLALAGMRRLACFAWPACSLHCAALRLMQTLVWFSRKKQNAVAQPPHIWPPLWGASQQAITLCRGPLSVYGNRRRDLHRVRQGARHGLCQGGGIR